MYYNNMFFRKYLAFYDATCPWVWCVIISWWLDRLFVELGHHNIHTCTHNDLQYVHIHEYLTLAATVFQTLRIIRKRKKQFGREVVLTGSSQTCLWHIYILQLFLVTAWTCILSVLLDVSPWLCKQNILQYRACIATCAFAIVFIALSGDKIGWDWSLRRGMDDLNTI